MGNTIFCSVRAASSGVNTLAVFARLLRGHRASPSHALNAIYTKASYNLLGTSSLFLFFPFRNYASDRNFCIIQGLH